LQTAMQQEFRWEKPAACPAGLELYLLETGDAQQAAEIISCHQNIAAAGAFSLGMLAEFESSLTQQGPWFYPRLFWETGLIGQVLYLEAEAAGIRATGIGCFFDDALHQLLGIEDGSWQSLYHFTIGGPVEDTRLKTLHPYFHLGKERT
jgi:nitroreductase